MSFLSKLARLNGAGGLHVLRSRYQAPDRVLHSTSPALALSKRQSRMIKAIVRKDDFGSKKKGKKRMTYEEEVGETLKNIGRGVPKVSADTEQPVLVRPGGEQAKFLVYAYGSAGNLLYWIMSSNQMYRLPESAQIFSPTLTYVVTGFSAVFWVAISLYCARNVQSLSFRGSDAGEMIYRTYTPLGFVGKARSASTASLKPNKKPNLNDSSFTLRLKNSRIPLYINGASGITDEDLFRKLQLGGANIMVESLRRCFSR
mmetsp:Transcript_11277/g.34523  ORF Transcript_11277/g.34523 Transcript_11277/m.34523 type:complete len:258 (+) Transcript_11277:109-882(+)